MSGARSVTGSCGFLEAIRSAWNGWRIGFPKILVTARDVAVKDFFQDTADGSRWGAEGVFPGGHGRFRGHFGRIAPEILQRAGYGEFRATYIGCISVRFLENRANPLKRLK